VTIILEFKIVRFYFIY